MARERPDHTLQPTALIHETYAQMVDGSRVTWSDRTHFLRLASRVMRRVLVNHARSRTAARRGGGWHKLVLNDSLRLELPSEVDVIDLDRILTKLADFDGRTADVVTMRVFGGMEVKEVAHALRVSERTVYKDWRFAKLWLCKELDQDADP